MTKSMNPKATGRKPLLSKNENNASTKPMVPVRKAAPFATGAVKSLSAFGTNILPKNWGRVTAGTANKLQEAIKSVGRAKANGTNRGPKC